MSGCKQRVRGLTKTPTRGDWKYEIKGSNDPSAGARRLPCWNGGGSAGAGSLRSLAAHRRRGAAGRGAGVFVSSHGGRAAFDGMGEGAVRTSEADTGREAGAAARVQCTGAQVLADGNSSRLFPPAAVRDRAAPRPRRDAFRDRQL